MQKSTKIIIIGYGSIGQRHYRNLTALGCQNIFVYDTDRQKTHGVKTIDILNQENLKNFDVAFICNPNNLHIETAIECALAGCHLFIEKPLSHNLRDIDKLIKICREKNLVNTVACNMRFHPCIKFIKNFLEKNGLGRIYSINHEYGYFLPYWRPKQDYRANYAAHQETGGGIILDDFHEFDLLFWFNNYETPLETKFIFDKVSDLEIETEDICIASFKFRNKVLGLVRCDYLQQNYTRKCKIIGEKGNLEWDFKENIVWLNTKENSEKLFYVENFDFNNTYIDEAEHFLSCVDDRRPASNDIKTSLRILEHLIKNKEYAKN